MLDNLSKYEVVLASNSPRRKELLQRLGIKFKVRTLLGVDESYPSDLPGEQVAAYISRKKAEAYRPSMSPYELLITADTTVHIDGDILGKPRQADDAVRMLSRLSGRTHQVITSSCNVLCYIGKNSIHGNKSTHYQGNNFFHRNLLIKSYAYNIPLYFLQGQAYTLQLIFLNLGVIF